MPALTSPRPESVPPVPLQALTALTDGHQLPGEGGASRTSDSRSAGSAGSRDNMSSPASTVLVSGITLRSDDVRPGDLFAAVPGSRVHGGAFVADAARAGAVAVLTDSEGVRHVRAHASQLPVLVVADPRSVLGPVAARIYDHPSRGMTVFGITGTSGKTTTCYLLEAALSAAGDRPGLIGTVAARVNGEQIPSMLTTPEATDLQALFAVMRERRTTAVAMEVSSHALAQGRVSGTEFAVGAFTNLSQDHLDFHGDMESYFDAKKLLFDGRAEHEVIVIDDDYGRRLAAEHPGAVTVSGQGDPHADWSVRARQADGGTQHLDVSGPDGLAITTRIGLPGPFNVANALTALACVAAAGRDVVAAASGLASVTVPGRMERVDAGQPFLVLVDYAHKPAALESVIAAARRHATGRVIVGVGAGGDRDRGKRPVMGHVAADGADIAIITDDNPRSEDPAAIRAELLTGAREATGADRVGRVVEIGDRREAIREAVRLAAAGDVVLIAGKGHEQGQEIAGVVHPFSDRDEVRAALTELGWG